MAKVLNAILTHQPPDCVARMLEWWRSCVPLDGVLIVAGGTQADFEGITHPQKTFVADSRLHTRDHPRELQSYTAVYAAIARWLAGRDFTHVLFAEYDHLPLVGDFNARHLARLTAEGADVLGYHVRRVDGTSDPHYLHHETLPGFHEHWEKLTCREDGRAILSMFGSGSLWTRAAFEAVAGSTEPFPIYLELYLPTLAHHLGFRVRDLPEQNPYVRVLPVLDDVVENVRATGAWSAHPVKRRWGTPRPSPARARVLWLPAHPTAGSVSMLRHWRELARVARDHPVPELEITCPLGDPPATVAAVGRLRRAWRKYADYPLRLGLGGAADVVHVLDHAFAHLLRFAPQHSRKIVTVHDLAPLDDGTLTPAQLRRFRRTLSWLNHADLLLPVSEFTAARLREFISGAPRIEVLPMGVDVAAFSRPRELTHPLPPAPRLLSIGTTLPRKNLAALPPILERVIRDFGPVSLIRVGGPLPTSLRDELAACLGPGRLVELGHLDDEKLVTIYQASDVLLFPSTLEGFGLPIAEAMAAGCAVVSSDAASLPEVGGDAALYFAPHDHAAAAARVVGVLSQPELRAGLIERGHRRANELSWENHFARLTAIYASIAPPRSQTAPQKESEGREGTVRLDKPAMSPKV